MIGRSPLVRVNETHPRVSEIGSQRAPANGRTLTLEPVAGGCSAVVAAATNEKDVTGKTYGNTWVRLWGYLGQQRFLLAEQLLDVALPTGGTSGLVAGGVVLVRWTGHYFQKFTAEIQNQITAYTLGTPAADTPATNWVLTSSPERLYAPEPAGFPASTTTDITAGAMAMRFPPRPLRRRMLVGATGGGFGGAAFVSTNPAATGVQLPTAGGAIELRLTGPIWITGGGELGVPVHIIEEFET